jgi:preprotein translocase subunit SecG
MLNKKIVILAVLVVVVALVFVTLNTNNQTPVLENKKLMHSYKDGSYAMDLETQETS